MSKKGYISDAASNRIRRIKTEIRRVTKKMDKLLNRAPNKGGIYKDSKRHKGLKAYIQSLKEALTASPKAS